MKQQRGKVGEQERGRKRPFNFFHVAMLLVLVIAEPSIAADSSAVTLTGNWAGTWTDSRESYHGGGGDFTCVAVDSKSGGWQCSFALGKSKTFNVELNGTRVGGEIHFDTTADLGKYHGVYTLKGKITADAFTCEYSGKDERGTFKMKRSVEAKK